MMRTALGVDIGSANIKAATAEGVKRQPSLIALEEQQNRRGERSLRVIAWGEEARKRGVPLRPVREGCAADVKLLALLLSSAAKEATGRRTAQAIDLYCALPGLMPELRRQAFRQAARLAGFHSFRTVDASLAGALGAGLGPNGSRARMLVDIGFETTRCAVIANGGVLFECMEPFGSSEADRAIQSCFREEHGALIGSRVAEVIKQQLRRSSFLVDARSAENGLPVSIRAKASHLRRAAEAGSMRLARFVSDALRALSPDLLSDVSESGVALIGGGARLLGLPELLTRELGLPVTAAKNAETAAADGLREYLFGEARGRKAAFPFFETDSGSPRNSGMRREKIQ